MGFEVMGIYIGSTADGVFRMVKISISSNYFCLMICF
jgi:hypothetical protein